MTDLLAARSQMAMSLGFHIIFAVVGIGMRVLMVVAEWRWRRSGDPAFLELAHRWAKGTAILFAVGAVSGTVLSFELGLLWPGFMAQAAALIGLPVSLEGVAFFTEAIFLGIYLRIGGWPDPRAAQTHYAIEIPGGLSLLAFHDPEAEVKGLRHSRERTGRRYSPCMSLFRSWWASAVSWRWRRRGPWRSWFADAK